MGEDLRRHRKVRVIAGSAILTAIAMIHAFRVGSYLDGVLYIHYYSYASDLMLPFGAYFLLSINETELRFLRKWYVKSLIVFAVMAFSEIMQFFGVYLFGVTFDMVDIVMYGVGAFSAAFCDKQILERLIPSWYSFPHPSPAVPPPSPGGRPRRRTR